MIGAICITQTDATASYTNTSSTTEVTKVDSSGEYSSFVYEIINRTEEYIDTIREEILRLLFENPTYRYLTKIHIPVHITIRSQVRPPYCSGVPP